MSGEYLKEYEEKTKDSKRLYEKAKEIFPGGVCHNIRYYLPYPFYADKAKGQYIWDVDGNRYCDYWQGHMALILGHSPDVVVKALNEQIYNGTHFGVVSKLQVELGEKVKKLVPCAEMLRFCNTGVEATMYACRLARAYTKKRIIVKVEGGWHGFNPTLMKGVSYPFDEPESLGYIDEEVKYTRVVKFNDIDSTIKVLRECKDDLAGFIVEPLNGSAALPADKEYLKVVKEEVNRLNGLLIFDEVITGFRLALGGAQEVFGIIPDLAAFGKILGGGLAVACVAGKKEVMKIADPTSVKGKRFCKIGGGTFSANPLGMVAGLATLNFLEKNKDEVYGKLERLGKVAREGVEKVLRGNGFNVVTTGMGSLFNIHFLNEGQEDVKTVMDAKAANEKLRERYHLLLLYKHNIFFLPGHTAGISYAHTEENIRELIDATEKVVNDLA
jgi:glutamate-1-semialdehyde 2,1-aminomutase